MLLKIRSAVIFGIHISPLKISAIIREALAFIKGPTDIAKIYNSRKRKISFLSSLPAR